MAFVYCKVRDCLRVREVQPYGPAYSTAGFCKVHLQCREEDEVEVIRPINTDKRKTIVLD